MHVKFEHIYVIDCSQWSISQAASGVYRGCKNGLVQAWVDLRLCSQVFLHVICPEHPHTPFFLISKLQIFSQTGWHSAWAIIAVHFKLSLSSRPALTVRLLGIKTGGASPSCGLMHYYIGLCSYCFKLCPVIRAFFFFLMIIAPRLRLSWGRASESAFHEINVRARVAPMFDLSKTSQTLSFVSVMRSYVTGCDHEDNVWEGRERNQCQNWSRCLISFGVHCIADWAFRPIQNQDCLSSL